MPKAIGRKYDDYVFIRLDTIIKNKLKERARNEGLNMTSFARQIIIRELFPKGGDPR